MRTEKELRPRLKHDDREIRKPRKSKSHLLNDEVLML